MNDADKDGREEYGAEENVKMGRRAVVIGGGFHNTDRSALQEQLQPRQIVIVMTTTTARHA